MNEIISLILDNLEKVGFGVSLFLGSYLANVILGIWKNVKIEGYEFNWKLIVKSLVKFIVLGLGIILITLVVGLIPVYANFVGIVIKPETIELLNVLVIIGGFLTATIRYTKDGLDKLFAILGN